MLDDRRAALARNEDLVNTLVRKSGRPRDLVGTGPGLLASRRDPGGLRRSVAGRARARRGRLLCHPDPTLLRRCEYESCGSRAKLVAYYRRKTERSRAGQDARALVRYPRQRPAIATAATIERWRDAEAPA